MVVDLEMKAVAARNADTVKNHVVEKVAAAAVDLETDLILEIAVDVDSLITISYLS